MGFLLPALKKIINYIKMNHLLKKIDFLIKIKNNLYNLFLNRRAVSEISFIPENLWSANSENGRKIIEGFLSFHNETIPFDLNTWKTNKSSKLWNEKLHSFSWIHDVRALGANSKVFLDKIFYNGLNYMINWDPLTGKMIFYQKEYAYY